MPDLPLITPEPFDLKKMVSGPLNSVFWAKTVMYGLAIIALLFVFVGVPMILYKSGYSRGWTEGVNDYSKSHPQQVFNAPSIVNTNVCKKVDHFGLSLKGCNIGLSCEK